MVTRPLVSSILLAALTVGLPTSVAYAATKSATALRTPIVTVTSPASGATYIAPAAITVTAGAEATSGALAKVTFYAGSTVIGSDTTAPYSVAWKNVPAGKYVLTAVATDSHGLSTTSSGVTVSVNATQVGNTPPTVAITAPVSGATFVAPATVNLTANATDSNGTVARVDFYAGTTLVGSKTAAPFTATWSNVPAGSYSFTAVATDNAGATTRSSAVGATVAPSVSTGPVVSLTSPANGATFPPYPTITAAAQASETGGTISSVVLFLASNSQKTVYTVPYTATWTEVPAGYYAMYALATDKAGVTTKSTAINISVGMGTASQIVTNKPPTVAITAPVSGAGFTAPATVSLTASASDTDGTIAKVDFYAGPTLVGSVTKAPYAGTWSNVTAGSYSITAVATDNSGAATRSAPVSVTVNTGTFVLPPGGSEPLVQPSNLLYQGSFRVPSGINSGGRANAGFEYGGSIIGFDPARNGLFMVGHDWDQFVGEISIPALLKGPLTSLATAKLFQPLVDVTEGRLPLVNPGDPNPIKIGGLLPYQGALYATGYAYYDGTGSAVLSHFVSGSDLSITGDVTGPWQVGTTVGAPVAHKSAGFVAGPMAVIPPEWQAPLGGPVLTGQCCVAVVSRTSWGPAAFAIDPTQLGAATPLPARPLVAYPAEYPLAQWGSANSMFNGTTSISGIVFPTGTRSVLYFGKHGTGPWCYGAGTTNQALDGTLTSDGVTRYCYDPINQDKGTHAFPYVYQVWAYDANDLARAAAGQIQPWGVRPTLHQE